MHFVNTYCETGPQLKSARKVVSFSPESRSPRLCTCESLDRLLFLLCDFKSSFSKFRYCISLADRKNNFVVKVYKSRYERAIINFRLKKTFQLCILTWLYKVSKARVYSKRDYMGVAIFGSAICWLQHWNSNRAVSKLYTSESLGKTRLTEKWLIAREFNSCINLKFLSRTWLLQELAR